MRRRRFATAEELEGLLVDQGASLPCVQQTLAALSALGVDLGALVKIETDEEL